MIVVGAGLAGLTAARELSGSGLEVVVLEARERIGGRTWTKPDALPGITLDLGAQSVDSRQPLISGEVARYGLVRGAEFPFEPPTVWRLRGERLGPGLPVPVAELADLERLLAEVHNAGAASTQVLRPPSRTSPTSTSRSPVGSRTWASPRRPPSSARSSAAR